MEKVLHDLDHLLVLCRVLNLDLGISLLSISSTWASLMGKLSAGAQLKSRPTGTPIASPTLSISLKLAIKFPIMPGLRSQTSTC